MKKVFKAEKISANVWWVGASDWNVRNFHGYLTGRGSTYNAYLIIDEKVTLVDTVKGPFADEMLARIASVIDPEKIDYIVSNHSEPDHSGALPEVIAKVKPEKVFASGFGAKTLEAYYGITAEAVPNGSSIPLGKGNLTFVETRMLHWPDSMVSFYDRDKVLFSQDAFGMHLAASPMWADECDISVLDYEARKYFANILNLQADRVIGLLDALPGLNLDIKIIAPDHGPLWRQDLDWILNLYRDAAEQKYRKRALVAFSTMWHSTEKLAFALAEGIRAAGVEVQLCDLEANDRSAVMTEVGRSGLIAFGAPTMNNQMFPKMADVLNYVKGLRPKNKIGFAFGSYGWSGEGAKQISAELEAMGAEQLEPLFQVKYMPSAEDLCKMTEIGKKLGAALIERCQ
jgi:flavorubredoxin